MVHEESGGLWRWLFSPKSSESSDASEPASNQDVIIDYKKHPFLRRYEDKLADRRSRGLDTQLIEIAIDEYMIDHGLK